GRYGYVNADGEIVIPPRFYKAWDFNANGVARVGMEIGGQLKFGYIDTRGKKITPLRFDKADDFVDDVARVWVREEGWGYINKKGEKVISPSAQ
ncbi:MAG: WG repeat-containing protein, partial [Zoogloeaceae bacterium]|nr:WG repeat-containing protein [Zoogloeaceae bacterium]